MVSGRIRHGMVLPPESGLIRAWSVCIPNPRNLSLVSRLSGRHSLARQQSVTPWPEIALIDRSGHPTCAGPGSLDPERNCTGNKT
jgi:hypothetical protein